MCVFDSLSPFLRFSSAFMGGRKSIVCTSHDDALTTYGCLAKVTHTWRKDTVESEGKEN